MNYSQRIKLSQKALVENQELINNIWPNTREPCKAKASCCCSVHYSFLSPVSLSPALASLALYWGVACWLFSWLLIAPSVATSLQHKSAVTVHAVYIFILHVVLHLGSALRSLVCRTSVAKAYALDRNPWLIWNYGPKAQKDVSGLAFSANMQMVWRGRVFSRPKLSI